MNTKLNYSLDWEQMAKEANWSAAALATLCGVSKDTLRRYFQKNKGANPKSWLAEERQKQGISLLREGFSIKEVAASLGYRQQTNFTRQFKAYWGACPSSLLSSGGDRMACKND